MSECIQFEEVHEEDSDLCYFPNSNGRSRKQRIHHEGVVCSLHSSNAKRIVVARGLAGARTLEVPAVRLFGCVEEYSSDRHDRQ
ncbi:hypothetical protein BAUCODRAFT_122078 [Baudoinia panamericana UAMH 10762]|uniref:Uncharacterized protein n=1 Tax=Baudoinia panamericana (strain UAMH 10762) TaxID=717646 RepID=M2MLV6_BAUPA|nr:uncharacterized protein BAUCODRAFT_122078 [Baudoinia panamericana UAMH 10762]EMC97651.1 hypothetical protein BAUCODRAFT_122078 [Baudoinia panamericana UAMH 10762]